MKEFMFQVSSGYSGRLKAKNYRRAKKELRRLYPDSIIYLLLDCAKIFERYDRNGKTHQKLSRYATR